MVLLPWSRGLTLTQSPDIITVISFRTWNILSLTVQDTIMLFLCETTPQQKSILEKECCVKRLKGYFTIF